MSTLRGSSGLVLVGAAGARAASADVLRDARSLAIAGRERLVARIASSAEANAASGTTETTTRTACFTGAMARAAVGCTGAASGATVRLSGAGAPSTSIPTGVVTAFMEAASGPSA